MQVKEMRVGGLEVEQGQGSHVTERRQAATRDALFRGLVERNQQRAYWMALDLLGDVQEAEDVSQEAFIRAYERLDSFRGEASIDTWFTRILVNMCLGLHRRRGVWFRVRAWLMRQPPEERIVAGPLKAGEPARRLEDRQKIEAIGDAMDTLSQNQRTAFVLRYLHDFSVQEVADAMGCASGTVKSHLFRALQAMRKQLVLWEPGQEEEEDAKAM